jgi:serine/threonine protein phosphatase 1
MRTLVIGDIHGNYKGLLQCLERAGYNPNHDQIISLGDIADGYPETAECVEYLCNLPGFIWILGNHDKWVQDWFSGKLDMGGISQAVSTKSFSYLRDPEAYSWISQGGLATYLSYTLHNPKLIEGHRKYWLYRPQLYRVINNRCFVHGGWNIEEFIHDEAHKHPHVLYWDRSLWRKAMTVVGKNIKLQMKDNFTDIFLGHTATTYWDTTEPIYSGGIWNIDTGAGWGGKLTIMDVETKEYWQSDLATELYPGYVGR